MSLALVSRERTAVANTITDTHINDWLDFERDMNDASEFTITAYRAGIQAFTTWLAGNGLMLGLVRPMDVLDYKVSLAKRYSPQTINLRLTAVRSFYRWGVAVGHIGYNPASEVKGAKRSKSKSHKRDPLTNMEVGGVLATCDTRTPEGLRDKAMLILFTHCALRQIEVHRADVGDLRTQGDRLVLYVQGKGHNDKDEFVVIPLREEPVIRHWLSYYQRSIDTYSDDAPLFVSFSNRTRGNRLSLRAIRGIVKGRYNAAGVVGSKKTTHSLRHSAITNAIRGGATPLQTRAMARHESLDTTMNYYHEVGRLDNPAEDLISYD